MTYTEQKTYPVGTGDNVTYHDPGNDGHPEKWVNGTVTGVSEEGFNVLWDDFKEKGWETEYEWDKVTFKGEQLIEINSCERNLQKEDVDIVNDAIAFKDWCDKNTYELETIEERQFTTTELYEQFKSLQ